MREVITYVAYNGEEFDNREECENYEREAFELLVEMFCSWRFFVDKQEISIFIRPYDIEDGLCVLSKAYNKCDNILVVKPMSDAAYYFADFQLGYVLPPNESGLYKYDTNEFEWVKADE